MIKGYLTVYLSLSLTLILSFIMTLIEGARINTIRFETECVADIGMNSVLSEYHRELLKQYDLLFVDMSYGRAAPVIENSAEHLRRFMQSNFTVGEKGILASRDWLSLTVDRTVISEYSLSSDEHGNVMRRQALDYMKESTLEGMLSKTVEAAGEVEGLGLNTRNIDQERSAFQSQIDAIELPKEETEEGEIIEIALDNPADKVNAFRGINVLSMVLKDTNTVSKAAVQTEEYLSHRSIRSGTGLNPELSCPNGLADRLLFDQYLFEKCGRYRKELEKSQLKYQIEYIIAGEGSDWDNLEKVANRLLAWREAANVIYILSDSGKCAQAEALALTLTAVLQVPALVQPVKYTILFAWAYIESLSDVKALLNGGKVPIMKTSGDWKTGIESVKNFGGEVAEGGGESGLDYADYLRIMLYLEEDGTKNLRAMDIMEMDIRKTPGNSGFKMDACFDSYLAEIWVSSGFGYSFYLKKRYGFY